MKIMIIGAHPADGVDLAGGTVCLHSQKGDEVIGVALTSGIHSHTIDSMTDYKAGELREIKQLEFKNAWGVLGVGETCLLGFRDEPLTATFAPILDIVELIRKHRPDMVITHHPNEYAHWDHSACGQMVCRALKSAVKLEGNKHWVNTVYFFGVQFRPETIRIGALPQPPDVLVDISEVISSKVNAMLYFESQGHNDINAMWSRMNSFESEMGRADGLKYSEGFILYYPLKVKLLPKNEMGGFYNIKEE